MIVNDRGSKPVPVKPAQVEEEISEQPDWQSVDLVRNALTRWCHRAEVGLAGKQAVEQSLPNDQDENDLAGHPGRPRPGRDETRPVRFLPERCERSILSHTGVPHEKD